MTLLCATDAAVLLLPTGDLGLPPLKILSFFLFAHFERFAGRYSIGLIQFLFSLLEYSLFYYHFTIYDISTGHILLTLKILNLQFIYRFHLHNLISDYTFFKIFFLLTALK